MRSEVQMRAELRQFVVDNFLLGDASVVLLDSDSFMATGTIDSTGMLELVMFLETTFGIQVADRELVPENLDSIDNVIQFVDRKQRAAR
jgi:acyl carrier protein